MPNRSNIVIFVGYRCTGKTTVAEFLGKLHNATVLDTDKEIEKSTQTSVSEIFAKEGEEGFRDKESKIIAEILLEYSFDRKPLILSTGGGAVIRPENRSLFRRYGYVVWLTASPEVILQRLQNDANTAALRPSLTSLPMLDEIRTLLEVRRPFYTETAHQTIDTDTFSPKEIADIITSAIKTN